MKVLICSVALLFASPVFSASNETSSCLPVAVDIADGMKNLNHEFAKANAHIDQIIHRYDAFLNATLPDMLKAVEAARQQVEHTTDLVDSRLSTKSLVLMFTATTASLVTAGVIIVYSSRLIRAQCCTPQAGGPLQVRGAGERLNDGT